MDDLGILVAADEDLPWAVMVIPVHSASLAHVALTYEASGATDHIEFGVPDAAAAASLAGKTNWQSG